MAVNCKQVWRQISDYIDDTISPQMRAELERHLAYCRNCAAIIDGVHNIILLVADGRTFSIPLGFSERLKTRLKEELRTLS